VHGIRHTLINDHIQDGSLETRRSSVWLHPVGRSIYHCSEHRVSVSQQILRRVEFYNLHVRKHHTRISTVLTNPVN